MEEPRKARAMSSASGPAAALMIPLGDIHADREVGQKLKVAGIVTALDSGSSTCVLSDTSHTAVFHPLEGHETSAALAKLPIPQVVVDLSFCLEDQQLYLPDISDKLLLTGYLDALDALTDGGERPLGKRTGQAGTLLRERIFRAIRAQIQPELDIAAWNCTARKISHYKWEGDKGKERNPNVMTEQQMRVAKHKAQKGG